MKMFYTENMQRRRPKPPRCICGNEIKRQLGIVSPSLYWIAAAGGKRAGRVQQENRTVFMLRKAVGQGTLESIVQEREARA